MVTTIMLAFSVGLFVGAALVASRTYRYCFVGYAALLFVMAALGVPCDSVACDLYLIAGFILLSFGVGRGLTALYMQEIHP